jgi:hypothetical protein
MEFHIFRGIFSRLYKLPPDFEYCLYAEHVMHQYILDSMDNPIQSWVGLIAVVCVDAFVPGGGSLIFGTLDSFIVLGFVFLVCEYVLIGIVERGIDRVLRAQGCPSIGHLGQCLKETWVVTNRSTFVDDKRVVSLREKLKQRNNSSASLKRNAHTSPLGESEPARKLHLKRWAKRVHQGSPVETTTTEPPRLERRRSGSGSLDLEPGQKHVAGLKLEDFFPYHSFDLLKMLVGLMRILTAFYVALLMVKDIARSTTANQWSKLLLAAIPPLCSTFFALPIMTERMTLLLSMIKCDLDLLGTVVEHMHENAELHHMMVDKILSPYYCRHSGASSPTPKHSALAFVDHKYEEFYEGCDLSAMHGITYKQFREQLAMIHGLQFTHRQFDALCRLFDHGRTKLITKDEWRVVLLKWINEYDSGTPGRHSNAADNEPLPPENFVVAMPPEIIGTRNPGRMKMPKDGAAGCGEEAKQQAESDLALTCLDEHQEIAA